MIAVRHNIASEMKKYGMGMLKRKDAASSSLEYKENTNVITWPVKNGGWGMSKTTANSERPMSFFGFSNIKILNN